ncbi:regulatory protein GemA [Pseudoalteromonas sp. S3260]|uniref:gp16 family protein n=1 Tax=Pseudoalteromonas sp. S3260 TaxID=579534 RepID=UPI00110B11E8|nr:regulatory protein GemA [Pseudoalteromonas sp. S3260]TMO98696.1 regulatory protein GemA [Pseudoalteromonas sp. S3260]
MTKAKLIQLIHIAKGQLGLDDDTYRAALLGSAGKTSCSQMSLPELNQVLEHFKKAGFKAKGKRRLSPKSSPKQHGEINKIRAIWITMHKQSFVRDGSETALDAYVNRMLNRAKVGANVSYHAHFLTLTQAIKVLEPLKKWHKREMVAHLKTNKMQAYEAFFDEITTQTYARPIPLSTVPHKSYQAVCDIFEISTNEINPLPRV